MRRALGFAVLAVLVALASFYARARHTPTLTDEERIREAIEQARRGVVAHRLPEILKVVSPNYDDGTYHRDTLRALIATGLRQYPVVRVSVSITHLRVRDEEADVGVEVWATALDVGGNPVRWEGNLRVAFARETCTRHLVFRDHCWRVVRVEGLGAVSDALEF